MSNKCDYGSTVTQFYNCKLIRDHKLIENDYLWISNGKIINPEPLFFLEQRGRDKRVDCHGDIIAPGLIDLQINGGFGYDFSDPNTNTEEAVRAVARGLLATGVTAFCPTLITQSQQSYHQIIPFIKKSPGSPQNGATVLGVHLEGPFICREKRGAHPIDDVRSIALHTFDEIRSFYKYMENVLIVTMAPELDKGNVIREATASGITISMGHSCATLAESERATKNGANFITHLFNAMLPFHHRDPGLVGLIASVDRPIYYGIIADNVHTHNAALNIAFRTHPAGMVLVTDASQAFGLETNTLHRIGTQSVEIRNEACYIAGTNTLCGSIAPLDQCVRNLMSASGCDLVSAIECASLHPAQAIHIEHQKGSLNANCDADFIMLNATNYCIQKTYIGGELAWQKSK